MFDANTKLMAGLMAASVVVIVVVSLVRFSGDAAAHLPSLPPRPAEKVKPEVARSMDYKPEIFTEYLRKDSNRFGVDTVKPTELSRPFPRELSERTSRLAPGKSIETRNLRVTPRVEKLSLETTRGSAEVPHLVLRIHNKTRHHLLYRVETESPGSEERCMGKSDLAHNAVGLAPGGFVDRTECVYTKGMKLEVTAVESMQVPELSYFYASRVYPQDLGLDPRTSRGHKEPGGSMCSHGGGQAIRLALERGAATWRDVTDFFARHRCETYMFPVGYRAFDERGQYELPVSAQAVSDAP